MGLVLTQSAFGNLVRFPHKIRAQLIKKAKALILDPHPPGSKKLAAFTTEDGDPVYRQRSGDFRILYVVRSNEVIVLDIDDRKDVYKMKTTSSKTKAATSKLSDFRMKASDFDKMIGRALGAPPLASKPFKKRRSAKKKR